MHARSWGEGTVVEIRPGVYRARRPRQIVNGKEARPSATFRGVGAQARALRWAREEEEPIEYLGQWLEHWMALKAASWRHQTQVLARRVVSWCEPLARKRLDELGAEDFQRLANELLTRLARETVETWRTIVRGALNAAVKRKLLPSNPLADVELPRRAERPLKAWTADEVAALLTTARGDAHEAWLTLAIGTGLRLGELRALTRDCLDLREMTLTVAQSIDQDSGAVGPTKTGRIRVVDLPEMCRGPLVAHLTRTSGPYVFGGKRPLGANAYRHYLRGLCARAGVRRLPVHATRHTFASLALDAGVPVQDVATAMGHASIAVTQKVYAHFIGRGQRRVAGALDRLLTAPLENGTQMGHKRAAHSE